MTALTYPRVNRWLRERGIDLANRWLSARDAEKKSVRAYYGDRPCLPAAALLEVCQRIFNKPTTTSSGRG